MCGYKLMKFTKAVHYATLVRLVHRFLWSVQNICSLKEDSASKSWSENELTVHPMSSNGALLNNIIQDQPKGIPNLHSLKD